MADASLADLQGPAGNTFDKYGTRNPLLRSVTQRFLREVDAAVTGLVPASLLDVGCGDGHVTDRLAALLPGVPTTGVDVADPALLDLWAQKAGGLVAYRSGSAYDLPFADASIDVVTAFEVFEHLERPAAALAELRRVARRALVLSVPWEPVWRGLNLARGRYPRAFGNTPGHVNHWTRAGFVAFCAGAGDVVAVRHPPPWTLVTVGTGGRGTASQGV